MVEFERALRFNVVEPVISEVVELADDNLWATLSVLHMYEWGGAYQLAPARQLHRYQLILVVLFDCGGELLHNGGVVANERLDVLISALLMSGVRRVELGSST